jgi:signal transduction histidine kinase
MKEDYMGLDQSLFFIYFVYGLAFFGMGLAMAMESWRASSLADARVLLPLAGFGLIHGTHEWMESYLLQAGSLGTPLPEWLPWLKLGFLVASFVSLILFAFQSLRLVPPPAPTALKHSGIVLAVFMLFILTSCSLTYAKTEVSFQDLLDVMARYLLALPASSLAALGLFYTGRHGYQNRAISRWLSGAALGFGLYAVTHLFVHPIGMFPANLVNADSFQITMGFPIQAVRTVAAIIITVCLLRATQITEESRRTELFHAQQARLSALEEQQELRRELLQHTVHAQEDERARIARELHDETAQTLSAFTLELATLRDEKLHKPEIKQTVERLQALSRDMSQGLYHLVRDLRPAQLDDLGLVPALRFLIEQDLHPRGVEIAFEVIGTSRRLDPLIETVLFRVGQEALTNLARHAQVQEGRLEIVFTENDVTLRVSDRGRGFDPTEDFHPPHGWGLAGMKERLEAAGGILNVYSAPNQGTLIEACVPLNEKEST